MKKILLVIVAVFMIISFGGCNPKEPTTTLNSDFRDMGNYTVEVIETYEDSFYSNAYVVKKTSNYSVGGIWVLITYDFEYELGEEIVVKWFGNDYCVPLVEYIDQTIDGYIFGFDEFGLSWHKKAQDE